MGIQIVGRQDTFYVLTLPATGLYAMLELTELHLQNSLEELPSFVVDISKVIKVLDVFRRVCVPFIDFAAKERRIVTPTQNLMAELSTDSQSRSRESPLKRHYN